VRRFVSAIVCVPLGLVTGLGVAAPGAAAAPIPLTGTLDLASAPPAQAVRWAATEVNGLAGSSVSGIGDFNGDGRPDLAVGEPKRDTTNGPDSGAVYVVLDAARGGQLDDAGSVVTIRGASGGDHAGFSVHGAGDVNGDGLSDLIIGAPSVGARRGITRGTGDAYVVFGRAERQAIDLVGDFGGWRITGAAFGDQLGRAVSSIADLNGDGLDEVIVGAPRHDVAAIDARRRDAGAAYVIFGRRESTPVYVTNLVDDGGGYRIDGPVGSIIGGAYAGRAVSSIADLNGDGLAEVLITAPRGGSGLAPSALPKGLAYVVWGRVAPGVVDLEQLGADGYVVTGRATSSGTGGARNGDFLGESIEPVGDVNGDARPDLVVGAHLADARDRLNVGVSYVLFGKGDTTPVDLDALAGGGFRITGIDEQDQSGFDTAGAGDFNADGIGDIVVSSLFAEPLSRGNAGAVYVVWGRTGASPDVDLAEFQDRALRIAGSADQDSLGYSVAPLGDVNGDASPDLVLGAPATNTTDADTGRSRRAGGAYVVFGATRDSADHPAAELVRDPGYQEERSHGCTAALNLQVLMEDNSYTDQEADPERIRLAGIQAYVATPRNAGTVLGVTGFSSDDGTAAAIIEPTVLAQTEVTSVNGALAKGVDGEDEFPGYPYMVRTFANENPGAGARLLFVDGYLFRDMDQYSGLTEGNPPTYVVAVGNPPDRDESDIRQMRRLAQETKGRYYEARNPRAIEKALEAIESRLRCDVEADDYTAELDAGETEQLAETQLAPGTHTADVRVTWREADARVEVDRITVVRDGAVVRRIGAAAIRNAYRASGPNAGLIAKEGKGFRTLHLRGVTSGATLRVVVRGASGRRPGTVYGRITQSRRRR